MNWLPLADKVRSKDGRCSFLLFPRLSDPDHAALYRSDIQSFARITAPIDKDFAFCETTESACVAAIQRCVTEEHYDGILLTTCHVGPELKLKEWVQAVSPRTRVIGLQHGFVQPWGYYETLFDSFDYLGVFGQAFVDRLSPQFRERTTALSLPLLDSYRIDRQPDDEIVLFALQKDLTPDVVKRLSSEIEASSGKKVVLRPHPEHVANYDGLRQTFAFSDPTEPLSRALQRVSGVITSGSTLALASLSMNIPTAVVPHLGGEEYEPFGIVADEMAASPILQILDRFKEPSFRTQLNKTLEAYTGRAGQRVEYAFDTLRRLLTPMDSRATRQPRAFSNNWLRRILKRPFA
ncbi:hypothetical protein AWB83_01406 [Caballeronia ptereochthonis]|uniref:Uncharacterized protein n=2 Tax=Caballeronia ptereochthonis TaxID=1777144 RepID=A0A158A788_9BURK|nr:hypothetical protein AWB83_01406 [Caballeronia ptereochthonis]